ncbi:hypothetical protein E1A91_D08G182000v1 [Gossypium mustelinum]|uniref:SURP motif domain-containing protein n=1 Tax=Gossypium mustelinum TaxID=34275 RepID=A0A5D2TXL1_GOSMU|nr:hypothetical protein E1A91_D08G182000v1 [Gossypium mustelinum]
MEKGVPSSLFVNDGSFMERFKQLQQQKDVKDKAAALEESKPPKFVKGSSASKPAIAPNKIAMECKSSDSHKTTQISSGGKLAFSLKQKPKLVAPPLKLAADDEEEEDQAAGKFSDDRPLKRKKLAPPSPTDPIVKKVADKLASFVAKMDGSSFSTSCSDYKYYEYRLAEEEKALLQNKELQSGGTGISASKSKSSSCRSVLQQSSYRTPASALYENNEEPRSSVTSVGKSSPSSAPPAADPITMMEFYMKKAAEEEKMRLPKQPKDEMLPPPPLQGEGLGSSKNGISDPIMAEVTPYDDIYEQYKKRMMLGYRYRPNPLNNPRKSYYYCMEPLGGSRRLCFNRKKVYAQLGSCFFLF